MTDRIKSKLLPMAHWAHWLLAASPASALPLACLQNIY